MVYLLKLQASLVVFSAVDTAFLLETPGQRNSKLQAFKHFYNMLDKIQIINKGTDLLIWKSRIIKTTRCAWVFSIRNFVKKIVS